MKLRTLFLWAATGMLVCLLLGSSARAQTSSVVGTITDPSGAVVEGTKVTATNTQTGAVRDVVSNETGLYRITTLVPGVYTLTVEKDGFKTSKIENLILTVNQTSTIDVALEIGAVTTTTEVNGAELPPR